MAVNEFTWNQGGVSAFDGQYLGFGVEFPIHLDLGEVVSEWTEKMKILITHCESEWFATIGCDTSVGKLPVSGALVKSLRNMRLTQKLFSSDPVNSECHTMSKWIFGKLFLKKVSGK